MSTVGSMIYIYAFGNDGLEGERGRDRERRERERARSRKAQEKIRRKGRRDRSNTLEPWFPAFPPPILTEHAWTRRVRTVY